MVIGWIGLGRMGAPMVEKIIKAGYQVKIWIEQVEGRRIGKRGRH